MRYYDYEWDLSDTGIILDEEINVDRLGWSVGDYFELKDVNGRIMLKKVDPLVAFIRSGAEDVEQVQISINERYG